MNATLYTGNGSTQTITNGVAGQSFQPDFVWSKNRSNARSSALVDSVRGATLQLQSNTTAAEFTGGFASLNSNGFSVNNNFNENNTSETYVGWNWKANGAGSSNTNGSITSTVSANTTSGFSIVQFTATGSNATVGHGLGVAPSVVIVKDAASTGNWAMYNKNLTSAAYYLYLNTTAAQDNTAQIWNSTAPTSSVFSIGTWHTADRQIAYCWAPIAGYSAFGSYTGNGSSDGPFIYTGFRPRFVMIKCSSTTGDWNMWDTSRSPYNQGGQTLWANLNNVEYTAAVFYDILSNGFKLRDTNAEVNAASTYIYMAFAENPFKYANAR
jgi:hypothetical protein